MSPVDPLEPSQTGFLMTKRPRMASKTASKLCLRPIPESAWKNGNFDPHKFIPQYSFDWSSLPDMKYTLTAHLPKPISGRNGKTHWDHICLESNLVNFDIPKTLKTVLDSPKRALSNRTMGGPLSKNVPVTPLRYKFHDFLLLIY